MKASILGFVHTTIWRRLPHGARRAAFVHATKAIAPRVTRHTPARLPIYVAGFLREASGLGAAARASYTAFKAAGLPVYGVDLAKVLKHDSPPIEFDFDSGLGHAGPGTLILHVSGMIVPLSLVQLGRKFTRGKRIVCHWFWELPELPRAWRGALPHINEIHVNTSFVADAVHRAAPNKPVHIVPYPLTPARARQMRAQRNAGPFTVLVMFNVASSFARKNPVSAIKAFRLAFGDDPQTRLIVKHSHASHWPPSVQLLQEAASGAKNITIMDQIISPHEIDSLYDQADVVLSLHRSEGLGLVLAEAMLRGIPVVATNWSGNTEFVTSETGMPIDFTLVPISDPQGSYSHVRGVWAEPDINAAAAALRMLRADPALREKLGQAAARHMAEHFAPERYVETAIQALDLKR